MAFRGLIVAVAGVAVIVGLVYADSWLVRQNVLKSQSDLAGLELANKTIAARGKTADERAYAYTLRAAIYSKRDQWDNAIADYRAAIALEPANSPIARAANRDLVTAYTHKHDYADAFAAWKDSLESPQPTMRDLLRRARIYDAMGDEAHALGDYAAASRADPTAPQPYIARAYHYERKGDNDRALAELDAAQRIAPRTPEVHTERVGFFWRHWDVARAIGETIIEANLVRAQQDIADTRTRAGEEAGRLDLKAGIADYTKVIDAKSGTAYDHMWRGDLFLWDGQQDRAFADYNEAIREAPKLPDARYYLADGYFSVFRFDDAIREDGVALGMGGEAGEILRNRGISEYALGRYDAAAQDLAAAAMKDPTDAYSALWLHLARLKQNRDDKAEFAKNTTSHTGWPRPVMDFMAGKIGRDKLKDAAGDTTNYITLRDQNCEADYYSGLIALEQGDKAAGMAGMRAAKQSCHPGFIEATMAGWALKQAG